MYSQQMKKAASIIFDEALCIAFALQTVAIDEAVSRYVHPVCCSLSPCFTILKIYLNVILILSMVGDTLHHTLVF